MTTLARPVRRLAADDIDAMLELVTLCEIAETGEPDPELADWITSSASLPSFHAFGIDDEAGLAGIAFVECVHGHAGLEAEVRVRPGLDLDLGRPLLDAVAAAASAFDPRKPLHLFANSAASGYRRWLEEQGAREIRHFWRMAIDLDGEPAVPPVPDGVVVRPARSDEADLRTVFEVVDVAFAEHFGHTEERSFDSWLAMWRARGAGMDVSLWWVAEVDGAPVAALLGTTFSDDDGTLTGHVGTLGTLKAARGRGIGTYLLRASFAEFYRRGARRVTLGVDSENGTGAVRLYESVGMTAVNDYPLYELPTAPA